MPLPFGLLLLQLRTLMYRVLLVVLDCVTQYSASATDNV